MKYNIFDVVELISDKKAIISEINNNMYKVKIVETNESKMIKEKEIKKVLYDKSNYQ